MMYQSAAAISRAAPSTTTPRKKPNRTSPGSVIDVGQSVGVLMSLEMPPNAASIWSAKITESAIVISAWRRSWPWFQRRKTCWMTTPMMPMIAVARSERDDPAEQADRRVVLRPADAEREAAAADVLDEPLVLHLQRDVAAEAGTARRAPC